MSRRGSSSALVAPPAQVALKNIDLSSLNEEQGLPQLETSGKWQSLDKVMKEALQRTADSLPTVFAAIAEELRFSHHSRFVLTVDKHLKVDECTFRFYVRGTTHQGSPCERIFQLAWRKESPGYFQLSECTKERASPSLSRLGIVRIGEAALEMAIAANGREIEGSVLHRIVH